MEGYDSTIKGLKILLILPILMTGIWFLSTGVGLTFQGIIYLIQGNLIGWNLGYENIAQVTVTGMLGILFILLGGTLVWLVVDMTKWVFGLLYGVYKILRGDYKVFERCD
jgi:hypothetical protein